MNRWCDITSGTPDGEFRVRLDPQHAIFRGHFPGNPVLPGICSLMIVRECASRMAGAPLRYNCVQESKFLSAIIPAPDTLLAVRIKLSQGPQAGQYGLDATIQDAEAGVTMLKLKASLQPDE